MWRKWLAVAAVVAAVLVCEFLLIRSTVSAFRGDLLQRPNCVLVDDAIRERKVPDARVQELCRRSARGLIYSLQPGDLRTLRR